MDKQYIAVNEGSYDTQYAVGSLTEIMEKFEYEEWDPTDFRYYELGKEIAVEFQKKLVLVVK